MRRIATTVLATCTLLVLAGCSGTTPVVVASTSPPPSSAPAASTPEKPTSRVPITCDQLASASTLAAIAGNRLASVSPVVDSGQPTIAPLATLQYGQLDCAWAAAPLTYNESPPFVTISVVPDVPSPYWAETAMMSEGTASDAFPGDSFAQCTETSCRLDTLVNDYWLSATVAIETDITLEQAAPLFSAAAQAVLTATAPGDPWIPQTAGASASDTGLLDRAVAAAALGATVDGVICGPTSQAREHWVAQAESGYAHCVYSVTGLPGPETAYADVEYIPGGSWGLATFTDSMNSDRTPLPQLGADAFATQSGPGKTTVVLLRGDDLVLVTVYPFEGVGPSAETGIAIAEAVVPALP